VPGSHSAIAAARIGIKQVIGPSLTLVKWQPCNMWPFKGWPYTFDPHAQGWQAVQTTCFPKAMLLTAVPRHKGLPMGCRVHLPTSWCRCGADRSEG